MANGKCRMHGGSSTGPSQEAAAGNQNARRHGLFSKALGEAGRQVYEAAKSFTADELARDTAEFVVAKVAETFEAAQEAASIHPLIDAYLDQLVDEKRLTEKAAFRIKALLGGPDLAALGKALGPLKGLLEVKREQDQDDSDDPLEQLRAAFEASRKALGGGS